MVPECAGRRAPASERAASGLLAAVRLAALCVLWSATPATAQIGSGASDCALSTSESAWIQSVLDGWSRVTRESLELDPEPLPWTILFDASCAWHLGASEETLPEARAVETALTFAGERVAVRALAHDGQVQLPNGARIPADVIAVAFPFSAGEGAFFVLALPEVWERHPQASRDPHLHVRILSVAFHEMLHTRQLPILRRRVTDLQQRYELPARFDDDVVETRFAEVDEYRVAFEAERALLYEALASEDATRRETLVAEALSLARRRRERFFTGPDAFYAELESLFLNMEGVAEWARFRYHESDPEWPNEEADILSFLRGTENSWSQDEGLALVLLLDRMVPDWKARLLGPEMTSPFALLREAVGEEEVAQGPRPRALDAHPLPARARPSVR